jgi:hypothetical protein
MVSLRCEVSTVRQQGSHGEPIALTFHSTHLDAPDFALRAAIFAFSMAAALVFWWHGWLSICC